MTSTTINHGYGLRAKLLAVAATAHLLVVAGFAFKANLEIRGMATAGLDAFSKVFEPYAAAWNSAEGYGFFSPNPPAMYGVRLEHYGDNDEVVRVEPFADSHLHRPRLYYHRRFLFGHRAARSFERQPGDTFLADRVAAHYLKEMPTGGGVELVLWRHEPPTLPQFLGGTRIDDPSTYRELYRRALR